MQMKKSTVAQTIANNHVMLNLLLNSTIEQPKKSEKSVVIYLDDKADEKAIESIPIGLRPKAGKIHITGFTRKDIISTINSAQGFIKKLLNTLNEQIYSLVGKNLEQQKVDYDEVRRFKDFISQHQTNNDKQQKAA